MGMNSKSLKFDCVHVNRSIGGLYLVSCSSVSTNSPRAAGFRSLHIK